MKKILLMGGLLSLISLPSFGQYNGKIKGLIFDSASNIKIYGATVAVLAAKDSILKSFTYTGHDGAFLIDGLNEGNYLLLVSFHDYVDYAEPFSLKSDETRQLRPINIQPRAKILAEVLVAGKLNAIKLQRDTTEFNAKAFVIQPNDKVEDLLRQLPGIQVDKDGKITAQGYTVSKVLVDGEEFFGDDPTLVTRNLRADMVSKVQLFDKKSDQTVFTGIDDGKRTKTINIKLKEDRKNGVFGKIDAGAGTKNFYQGQAFYNRFRKDEKLSGYGTVANTGKVGLNFIDNSRLSINGDLVGDNGIISLPTNGDLDATSGLYDGRGLPSAATGGVHYDNKWNDSKISLNSNYRTGYLGVSGTNTSSIQQSLPSGVINSVSAENFTNSTFRQKFDLIIQKQIDTLSNLKIAAGATLRYIKMNNDYATLSQLEDGSPINSQHRSLTDDGNQRLADMSLLYTRKFWKPRRTISWAASGSFTGSDATGYLNSLITFYKLTGGVDSNTSINQLRRNKISSATFANNIAYTEPLNQKISLAFNYGFTMNNSTSTRLSYNQASGSNEYNVSDPLNSNNFSFTQTNNQVGTFVNFNNAKVLLNIGTKMSVIEFKQKDLFEKNIYQRHFFNWLPQLNVQYNFTKYRYLIFNYSGKTIQPTVQQLQPVQINDDPLFIVKGNPLLDPAFLHNFTMTFRGSKPVSGFYFFISPTLNITNNAVVRKITTDVAGKTTIDYTNLREKSLYQYDLFMNVGYTLKSIGLSTSLTLSTNGNTGYSFINGALNESHSRTYSAGLALSKNKQKSYALNFSITPGYLINKFSLQPGFNNNAFTITSSGRLVLFLPAKLQLTMEGNSKYIAKTTALPGQRTTLLNCIISKMFLKDNNLRISLSGYDLLNQNLNVTRDVTGNTIAQYTLTGITRYFLLTVTWDFNRFKTIRLQK